MSPARPRPQPLSRSQSALAWLLACVVFALGLFGASPALHAQLHPHFDHHEAPADRTDEAPLAHDDGGCAVTLFQQGTTVPLALPTLTPPLTARLITILRAPEAPLPLPPSHRLHPSRGPPSAL